MKFSKQSKSFSLVKVLHGEDNAIEGKVRISKNYFKINILINGRLTYLRKPLAYFQQKLEINELTVQIVINEYNKHPNVGMENGISSQNLPQLVIQI